MGSAVSSLINVVMFLTPQEDPLLNAVKDGFNEVNRKLDSLSSHIADLAADMEWSTYTSTYSQDEHTILNNWEKFQDVIKSGSHNLKGSHKVFTISEYRQIDDSVKKLNRYLTVNTISLSKNITDLLKNKFKCVK